MNRRILHALVLSFLPLMVLPGNPLAAELAWQDKVDDQLIAAVEFDPVDILVFLGEQADLTPPSLTEDRATRGRRVCVALQETASRTQPPIRNILEANDCDYRAFWICNAIAVRHADRELLARLAAREDIVRIVPDPSIRFDPDEVGLLAQPVVGSRLLPWNIDQIGAPSVWATGNTGQGGVVGILDTGCDWLHPAVRDQYRGWNGSSVDHDYNWHDAAHEGGGPCGHDSPEPCDDNGHGTHVLGTAVGDDGEGMQIGVAPGAGWIACRAIVGGWSSPSMFYEGFEWMMAPTPVAGGPGDPDRAPDVITAAWYCPPGLGCSWGTLLPAIAAVRAAGIVVCATASGDGPGCESIMFPPAVYDESYTIGSTAPDDIIASFSGRGPVVSEQGILTKPDITAPGVNVLSCLPGDDYAYWSGTAMAVAHVAGVVALLVTAAPGMSGDVLAIEERLNTTAEPLASDQCGDGDTVPNNVYGHGRVDAAAACAGSTGVPPTGGTTIRLLPNAPNPFAPLTQLIYELDRGGAVDLSIYDVSGRLVRRLVSEPAHAAGRYTLVWDGRDEGGRAVAAGVYLSRLRSNRELAVKRILRVQ